MINARIILLFFVLCTTIEAYYAGSNKDAYRKHVFSAGVKAPPNAPKSCGRSGDLDDLPLDFGLDESYLLPNEVISVPYQVLIGNGGSGSWICAGILINEYWVLSAAHCAGRPDRYDATMVRLGEKDIDFPSAIPGKEPIDIPIAEVIVHPQYDSGIFLLNDLALIRMEYTFPEDRIDIQPICLPWGGEGERDFVGTEVYEIGRVKKSNGIASLNTKGAVRLLSPSKCGQMFGKKVRNINEKDYVCSESVIPEDEICEHLTGSVITYRDYTGRATAVSLITAGYVSCPLLSMPLYTAQNLKWIRKVAF